MYLSPKWISAANSLAVSMAGRPDRDICEAAGRIVPRGECDRR